MISNGSATLDSKGEKLETKGSESKVMTEQDEQNSSIISVSNNNSQDDVSNAKKISEFFEANASAIEKWLNEKAPDEVITQISNVVSKRRTTCEREHRSSVTSELYQQWLSSSSEPTKKVRIC